ncbi:MAG: transglutaminase domain-containing protein [Clostridiales bacterium]|nr:transglutaminase domain-containing protein [Clostridiales bacterium]
MRRYLSSLCILFVFVALLCACQKETPKEAPSGETSAKTASGPPRDASPVVLTPEAAGTTVFEEETALLDLSHAQEGYFMVRYTGTSPKVRVQVEAPDGTSFQPILAAGDGYRVFPLSGGNGTYRINILENIQDNQYAILLSQTVDVSLTDEFLPFLYPNQYVDFQSDTAAVKKGAELAQDTYTDLEVIENIYHYVIRNVTYDDEKATQVKDGYIPSVDETLASKTGICFDYASLMTCMMRSQRIPTKLEIGYSGDIKHAWISAYIDEIGWVDRIIEFDGSSWTLMDPTLAANNERDDVKKYVGDGSNYTLQYSY